MANITPDNYEWDNVVEESPILIELETSGEFAVGEYVKSETITFIDKKGEEKEFLQLLMRGVGIGEIEKGTLYAFNCGYKLQQASKKLDEIGAHGKVIKVTRIKDVDTGAQEPMIDFRVDVAR